MAKHQRLCLPGQFELFGLHHALTDEYPFLLESRLEQAATGRYSLLLAEPGASVSCRDTASLQNMLRSLPTQTEPAGEPDELPFEAGWFVYLAYEASLGLQPHLSPPPDNDDDLLALAVECHAAIIVDHLANKTWVFSETGQADKHAQALQQHQAPLGLAGLSVAFQASDPLAFKSAVKRAIDYILAGDIYQANLSRRWRSAPCDKQDLLTAYAQMRVANAADFAASVQHAELRLASASPERLFQLKHGMIDTRPIAGTRPRGQEDKADAALRAELLANPKEQAEHIMLVDLERNDLGRVCETGSVEVNELLALESYASVHHIVSNVRGKIAKNVNNLELFEALFPGGTITGCPKIRCLQIIAELEQRWRGAYTGSLGYVSRSGRMDFNILIRTLVHTQNRLQFDAGAGIVVDSDPERELRETEAKAAGIMRALA